MSVQIEIDMTEPDSIGIVTDGTPEWMPPNVARKLAADLIRAADQADHGD